MTYSDAAGVLGRSPGNAGRHLGQVTSRIDAACFCAELSFLAMHCVRETHGGKINPRSFQDELWRSHTAALVAPAEGHVWSGEDFEPVKTKLQNLGDDEATLQWKHIEQFGQKGVEQAVGIFNAE